ncbi:hypothetical protein DP115_04670 [Brasilonema octagenarum UFV-OR1]|nr:hypothetical protein [Brasilonema octagenarum UFV-OR1]
MLQKDSNKNHKYLIYVLQVQESEPFPNTPQTQYKTQKFYQPRRTVMNHPFGLDVSDLEAIELNFEEELNDEEAAQVLGGSDKFTTLALGEEGGGGTVTTQAVGEEGGGVINCISAPCPGSETGEKPPKKPPVTKGWFEIGGHFPW